MAISKRNIKAYVDPGLNISPGSGLLCIEDIQYIVRTAVKNIAGNRTLVLYFYNREQATQRYYVPAYTMFQSKDDYITWEQPAEGKGKWRVTSLERMGGNYNSFADSCAFYSPKDKQRVTQFCKTPVLNGLCALKRLQQRILDARTKQRVSEREQKILNRMNCVPAKPRDIQGFFHREVLPAYIFYTYHKSKKPMKGYCSACRHDVLVTGARNNCTGICPHCKREITFKTDSRSKSVWNSGTAQVVQRINDNELVIRVFKGSKSYRGNFRNPKMHVWENARFFLLKTGKDAELTPYYYSYNKGILTRWQKGYRPVPNKWCRYFEAETCGHLYHRNLDTELNGTAWQYCQLKQFYISGEELMDAYHYLHQYLKYPFIEYLMKLGLRRLTQGIVYTHGGSTYFCTEENNVKKVLMVQAEDIPHLQSINADLKQLSRLQKFRRHPGVFERKLYSWCFVHDIDYHYVETPLRYMTGHKLIRYIEAQFESLHEVNAQRYDKLSYVLQEYNDFLRTGENLAYDFTDSFVLFPRYLKEAHDLANKLLENQRRRERERKERKNKKEANKVMAKLYRTLCEKYRFTSNGLTVIPPKTAEEIISEGHKLHHCVGRYYTSHANGNCIILFIRKEDSADTPYYTMEVQDGEVQQVRGKDNNSAIPDIQSFVDLWKKEMLITDVAAKAA